MAGFCHEKGVDVQGELGSVPYLGEAQMGDIDWDKYMTSPEQAKLFIEKTGIDVLAVAIGNAHGFLKERSEPDFERMQKINACCDVPFVLHGASDWENGRVVEAIKNGVSCFNVDTAIRVAFINNLVNSASAQAGVGFDMRKILSGARDAVKETVKGKMRMFGSEGKA